MNTQPGVSLKQKIISWSPRPDSNRRPPPYHGGALPTELHGQLWWREKDSNLRRPSQQIYSLPPLAARESLHNITSI